jgi:tRNA nucleotidyltransferase (CCA-adding enzyme)
VAHISAELTLKMIDCGLTPHMGLPVEPDRDEFSAAMERSIDGFPLHPAAAAAGLLRTPEDAASLHARLKMSGIERDMAAFVVDHRGDTPADGDTSIRHWQWLVSDAKDTNKAKDLATCTLRYRGQHDLADKLQEWPVPKFPVSGNTLVDAGCPRGPAMSVIMKRSVSW